MNVYDRFYKADYSEDDYLKVLSDATDFCLDPQYSLEEGEDDRGYYIVINPVIKTFEEKKMKAKAEIASARYEYEISGITFRDVHITTDREDQAMITATALSAVLNPTATTVWKGANGYLTLKASEILEMARAVADHVESAFIEEKRLVELIDSATTEEELSSITWTL